MGLGGLDWAGGREGGVRLPGGPDCASLGQRAEGSQRALGSHPGGGVACAGCVLPGGRCQAEPQGEGEGHGGTRGDMGLGRDMGGHGAGDGVRWLTGCEGGWQSSAGLQRAGWDQVWGRLAMDLFIYLGGKAGE